MNHADYTVTPELERDMQRLQQWFLGVGLAALVVCGIGGFFNPEQFFHSYLMTYMFWVGIALGSMAITMLHYLAGGAWGLVVRRIFESAFRTFPLLFLLFIPVLLGLHNLYVWTHADAVAKDGVLRHKALYLNVPFFLLRAGVYFAVWIAVSYCLSKWSLEMDRTRAPEIARRLQLLSGPGLVLYVGTVTFASIDWVMSLDPHWFSTIFGFLFVGAQGISALCFAISVAVILAERGPLAGIIKPGHLHDLGKLLLTFIMLWAYFNFSQFLIIWSGNLPEEITWYVVRTSHVWKWIGLMLVVFHFALPFVLLLSRELKQSGRWMTRIALLVIAMRFLDLFWQIAPSMHQLGIPWMFFLAPVGMGGIWLAMFMRQLKQRPLLPVGDPSVREVLASG